MDVMAATIGVLPAHLVFAVMATVAVAMFVRSVIGFGDALLAMPVLTMLIGVRKAVPVVTALSLTVAAIILVRGRCIDVTREAASLLLGAVPGVTVG